MSGNWYSEIRKSLRISFRKCNSLKRNDCIDDPAFVRNHFLSKEFDVVMIDSYFDLESFDKPIKNYLTQNYAYQMEEGFYRNVELFLKENQLDLSDDYKVIGSSESKKFYSIANGRGQNTVTTGDYYGEISFSLHTETQIYKRTVFTILDVLSQIGGIFSLLQSLCGVIVGIYAQKKLYFSVFSKCYTFDPKENGFDKYEEGKEDNLQCK